MTLRSIARTTYWNYEVVVVDDGSTLPEAHQVFDALKKEYHMHNWHFYKKENEYLGRTRNYSVEKAKGEYIIFVDADNAAKPEMVERFLFGIYKSGADCLTCHVDEFVGRQEAEENTETFEIMVPMGPVLELGMIENVFGDANFIIKKECYKQVGGFPEERLSLDDWCFLARLSLQGFRQDVIPDLLFHYRVLEGSMVRTGNNYPSLKRILSSYHQSLPHYARFMLEGIVQPLYHRSEILYRPLEEKYQGLEEQAGFLSKMMRLKARLEVILPKGSLRRKAAVRIARIFRLV